jgi:hypothetical protein
MQRTPSTQDTSGGHTEEFSFPRSKIYVSSDKEKPNKKYIHKTKEGSFHFFLVFTPGENYTQEGIENCEGTKNCYNCNILIKEKIFFYPIAYTKVGVPVCSPIPHCRPECVLQTIDCVPNNHDLKTNFYMMYGPNYTSAPPRFLLYVPGGLTLEEYHNTIDDNLTIVEEEKGVRSFLAPMYISCTFLKNHQLVKDVISLVEEFSLESKTSIGPSRMRDNSDMEVVDLEPKNLFDTKLSKMFDIDPSSYRRKLNPDVKTFDRM